MRLGFATSMGKHASKLVVRRELDIQISFDLACLLPEFFPAAISFIHSVNQTPFQTLLQSLLLSISLSLSLFRVFSSVMKRASLGANVAKQSLEREGGEEETAKAQSPKIH
jgi:hypothetical protein